MRSFLALSFILLISLVAATGIVYDNQYGVTLFNTKGAKPAIQTASPDEIDGARLNDFGEVYDKRHMEPSEYDIRRSGAHSEADERQPDGHEGKSGQEAAGDDAGNDHSLAPYKLNNSDAMQELEERVQEEKFDPEELGKVKAKLRDAHIIPDVLPDSFVAEFPVSVRYGDKEAAMGQVLSINETREEPTIEFDAPPNEVFTVAIVDPDAPATTRHGYRSFRHFLVSNLDSTPDRPTNIITEYLGPLPSFNSGFHRYAVVVLKQKEPFNVTRDDVPKSRVRFDAVQWGNERGMKPVAATYFVVKRNHVNDDLD